MSDKLRRLPTVSLVAALAVMLWAAAAGAQSPFALRNIGQRIVADDARMTARGFGMTVEDSLHPGFKNVASLTSLRHVALKFTGYGESADHSDANAERHTYRTYAPDIRVGMPVIKGRLAVSAGFSIFRSSHFQTRVDTTWQAFGDSIVGNHQFVREGSLFTVPLGVSWQPRPGVSLGASLNLVRGAIRDAAGDFFEWPSIGSTPFYQPNSVVLEDRFSGTSATVAALVAPLPGLRLGASYTPAYEVNAEREVELQGVGGRARDSYVLSLPAEYRAGFAATISARWRAGGDLLLAPYSELRGRADWEPDLQDEHAWSVGIERVGARERRGGWNNLPVRVSTGFRRWAYTIGGEPVDEWTWAAGTGFPFRGDMGQLDVALAHSRIGSVEANGRESSVWRLTVSVTGLETWW